MFPSDMHAMEGCGENMVSSYVLMYLLYVTVALPLAASRAEYSLRLPMALKAHVVVVIAGVPSNVLLYVPRLLCVGVPLPLAASRDEPSAPMMLRAGVLAASLLHTAEFSGEVFDTQLSWCA